MFPTHNFIGIPPKKSCPSDYLYELLQFKENEDLDKVNDAINTFKKVDHELMYINQKQEHPILHEVCEQAIHNFELLKGLWELPNLKSYWNNKKYVDKYGLTALERLSIIMNTLHIEQQKWIKENMKVNSLCDYENMFHSGGSYNVKYIRENCKI